MSPFWCLCGAWQGCSGTAEALGFRGRIGLVLSI